MRLQIKGSVSGYVEVADDLIIGESDEREQAMFDAANDSLPDALFNDSILIDIDDVWVEE